jgi:simple sugar transport system ATP-binding protein
VSGLAARGVTKRFGGRAVLEDVSFSVAPGEVVALVGENGAGKTTLLRVVSGFLRPEEGHVEVDGARVALRGPRDAAGHGVGMVHQHFLLVPELTVAENVVLGAEPGAGPLLDLRAAREQVRACADRFGFDVDPGARVGDLGVAQRQHVELLKVLVRGARFLLLDEPTGLLPPAAVRDLFALVRRLASEGCGVVLVTHRLQEVMDVCSRATVLRRGRVAGDRVVAATTSSDLARLMVGEDLTGSVVTPAGDRSIGDVLLRVRDLSSPATPGRAPVQDVSLELRAGEIVGLAGVSGNGQVELLEALAGLRPCRAAEVSLAGVELRRADPRARRRAGLGYVPEDRVEDGLLGDLTVAENLALTASPARGVFPRGWIDRERMRADAAAAVTEHDVRPPDPAAIGSALSGGNQQKVLVARELLETPRVLLASEPVRGLDFRATEGVFRRLRALAAGGGAVLLSSTDLGELLEVADRIVVICAGRVTGEVVPSATTEEELGLLMAGAQ